MAEYNFWDDRTYDTCDENWCPIANDYCLKDENSLPSCDYCKEMQDFMRYVNEEEKRKQLTYSDLAHFIFKINCSTECYCKWCECWDCCLNCKDTFSMCSEMKWIAYNMILDHLY